MARSREPLHNRLPDPPIAIAASAPRAETIRSRPRSALAPASYRASLVRARDFLVSRPSSDRRADWADRSDPEFARPRCRRRRSPIAAGCSRKESPGARPRQLRAKSRRCARGSDSTAFRAARRSSLRRSFKKTSAVRRSAVSPEPLAIRPSVDMEQGTMTMASKRAEPLT